MAETYAQQQRVKRSNEGSDAFSMTSAERLDAEHALELLRPLGHSLTEAARFYQKHLPTVTNEKLIDDVVGELLAAKEKDGVSLRYLKDLRTRLKIFAESFPEKRIGNGTGAAIDDWLRGLPHGPVTRNNYRRLLSVLFDFAKQRGYCVENPVQETAKAKVVRSRPGILPVDQVQRLLSASGDEILPALAIGVFAGLRPESEIWRLDWSKIDFGAKHIDVSADSTKTIGQESDGAAERFVTMQPNLIKWLKPFAKKSGPVSPIGDRYFTLLHAARKRAEILALKRVALQWAQQQGFRIAAAEVSLPNRGVRMDVAAYRPQRSKRQIGGRMISCAAIGVTAIFECKVSTPDFRRDARSITATAERLGVLLARKLKIEEELKIFYPSIRNGDSLFQEFETLNFERPGYERYEKVIGEIRQLSSRLHENTKFERLTKYGSANLYYLVADAGILEPHEMPADWGWLRPVGDSLELAIKPIWHEVDGDQRLEFLHRISMTATRALNRGVKSDLTPRSKVSAPTPTSQKPF